MPKALSLVIVSLVVLSGCMAERQRLGEIRLRPYGSITDGLQTFSLQKGRILSPDLDLVVEADGCIRGSVRSSIIELCQKGSPPAAKEGAELVEHWQGLGGDFIVELEEKSTRLRADGYLRIGPGSGSPIQVTLPLGQGPQWDEIRRHPAFLAVAAAISGVRGEPDADALERFTR